MIKSFKGPRGYFQIVATSVAGKGKPVHLVDPSKPVTQIGRGGSGYRCRAMMRLEQPTLDGAQTAVEIVSTLALGEEQVREFRIRESTYEIISAFRKAGLGNNIPKIVPQGIVSIYCNRILRTLRR